MDDYAIALSLHHALNGADSNKVLSIQRNLDASTAKSDYRDVYANPAYALFQPVLMQKYYPWKVVRSQIAGPLISTTPVAGNFQESGPLRAVSTATTTSAANPQVHRMQDAHSTTQPISVIANPAHALRVQSSLFKYRDIPAAPFPNSQVARTMSGVQLPVSSSLIRPSSLSQNTATASRPSTTAQFVHPASTRMPVTTTVAQALQQLSSATTLPGQTTVQATTSSWIAQATTSSWAAQAFALSSTVTSAVPASRSEVPIANHLVSIAKPIKQEKDKLSFAARQHLRNEPVASSSASTSILANAKKPFVPCYSMAHKRITPEDFHVPLLNGYIKATELKIWKAAIVRPELQNLFTTIRTCYFKGIGRISQYKVAWESFTDLTNFRIDADGRAISFNTNSLLKCSRGRLFSAIVHALIHCTVYETSSANGRQINEHDINFMEIMKIFNDKLDLEIGTDHTFLRNDEEKSLFKCTGCLKAPFYGVVKCNENELPNHGCEGKFHRVFEANRTINNNVETQFFFHSHIESPNPIHEETGANSAIGLKPREFVDITDDNEEGRVQVLTRIIDLDDQQEDQRRKARKVVQTIRSLPDTTFETCPICRFRLVDLSLRPHMDICLGEV